MNDTTDSLPAEAPRVAAVVQRTWLLYIVFVLAAILGASYYHLRSDSLFGCQAGGYSSERYLVYCQTNGYGDFDHGAFWFDLEPEATKAAASADLMFVGNSRMQYGFSTGAAHDWLANNGSRYFLLGFAYHPRVMFQRALLGKLSAHARVYVINLDSFFEENASVPARYVMTDSQALSNYRVKQFWQSLHRPLCGTFPVLCGNSYTIFRSKKTGEWQASGLISATEAPSVETKIDADMVAREVLSGNDFLDKLGVDRRCVIFTLVPTVDAQVATSAAIAKALGVEFIAPEVEDLLTFDGSHLDRDSAERWSGAFFDAAGARIRDCLGRSGATAKNQPAAASRTER